MQVGTGCPPYGFGRIPGLDVDATPGTTQGVHFVPTKPPPYRNRRHVKSRNRDFV
jgi:hypothetical protein